MTKVAAPTLFARLNLRIRRGEQKTILLSLILYLYISMKKVHKIYCFVAYDKSLITILHELFIKRIQL
jgi:hypothetical protein